MNQRRLLCFMVPLFLAVLMGCSSLPPEAPCKIEGLLLSTADLPGNQWADPDTPSSNGAPKRLGVERIGIAFGAPELFDGVNHQIYRLIDKEDAFEAYQDIEEEDFSTVDYLGEWTLPSELSQIQSSADIHGIGCNLLKYTKSKECRILAQYGPYVVRFSIRLQNLQYSDVSPLFIEIDNRMAGCLSSK